MTEFFVADDLSGALDAAGAFHRAGRSVTIGLSLTTWPEAGAATIVALTTETRNAPPAEAAATVTRALALGRARGARLVYKKIDSTLRGAVAAELTALLNSDPEARVLFAPANPAVGRTVRNGLLLVRGVPVAETEFARDPLSPVRESAIRRLLGAAATERVTIPDIETEADLGRAVAAMDEAGPSWVGVGSGALARPVAARGVRAGSIAFTPQLRPPAGPALLVCGSAHAGNREQAAVLERERGISRHEFRLDAPQQATDDAIRSLRAGRGAALMIEERRGDSSAVVQALAAATDRVLAATTITRVFITGGETAFAVGRTRGLTALEFQAEVEPGLSVACSVGGERPLWLAIKPGGFGDARTWVRAWDALQPVT